VLEFLDDGSHSGGAMGVLLLMKLDLGEPEIHHETKKS
jgi:hypothetical protein